MDVSDAIAVEKWLATGDAEAFQAISLRYSGMVFSTCKRILGNPVDAEDAAQECFETLCCTKRIPAGYLGPWLHRVATNRCLKRLKSEERRRIREHEHVARRDGAVQITWDDIYEFVDEEIAALPDRYRAPLIAYFFENRTHTEIAEMLGVSRQTITYRLTNGIERLRSALRRRGIEVATAAFAAMLAPGLKAQAAPASLNATLARLALAGATPSAASGGVVSSILGTFPAKLTLSFAIAASIVSLGMVFWWASGLSRRQHSIPGTATPTTRDDRNAVSGAPAGNAVLSAASGVPPVEVNPPSHDGPVESEKTYSFGGITYTPRGELLAGVEVNAFATGLEKEPTSFTYTTPLVGNAWQQRPRHWQTLTDAKGNYTFRGIDSGGFVAVAALKGEYAGYVQVELKSDEPRNDVNIALHEMGLLSGRVLGPDGAPVPRALVELLQTLVPGECGGRAASNWIYACTNGQGIFTLGAGLPDKPGLAVLAVTPPAYPQASFNNVPVGTPVPADLKLETPARVSGRVTWRRAEAHKTNVVALECDARITHETASIGALAQRYEADIAPDGTFHFDAVAPAANYVIGVCETPPFCANQVLGPLLPGEQKVWDIEVRSGGVLQGHVYADGKTPVAGVVVQARNENNDNSPNVMTGSDGAYKLLLSSPGVYMLAAAYSLNGNGKSPEQRMECEDGGDYEVDFSVPAPFIIPIRILDVTGAPVPDVVLDMDEETSESTTFVVREIGRTGPDGRYICRTYSPDPHSFEAHKPGYAQNVSARLTGSPGEQFPEQTIVLYASGGIEGIAVNEQGAPIARAAIDLHVTCPECREVDRQTYSEADGTFVFPDDTPATDLSARFTVTLGEGDDETELSTSVASIHGMPGLVVNAGEIVFAVSRDKH